MEALYKKRKNGFGERTVRAKVKETSSKNKRAELLATKRKIPRTPLGVLEVDDEKQQQNRSPAKQISRLDKLKEWKKAREEARTKKDKENAKKPPPFRCGRPIQAKSEISKQSTSIHACKFTIGTLHKPKPNASSTCMTTDSTKLKRSVKSSNPTTHTHSKANKNPSVATRASSRLAAKAKEENLKHKPSVNRPQTRSVTKSMRATKTVGASKKSPIQRKTSTIPKQASSSKSKSTKTVEKSKSSSDEVNMERDPQRVKAITRNKSHLPANPSPLLKSQRPKTPKITFVNHPAWIPNAVLSPSLTSEPNFDAMFKNPMSPFQFTAGTSNTNNQQFAFTFKKEVPSLNFSAIHISDSFHEDESTSTNERVTPNAKLVQKSLSKSRSSRKRNRRVTNYEDDLVVQVLDMDSEDPITPENTNVEMTPVVLDCEQEKEQVDVAYFRGLHSDVVDKLTGLCEVWDQKAVAFEQEETGGDFNNKEEVLGQIRTTVCQAQLLMRQKLKQYLGLVDDAETQKGERKTTAEDLQGFWDMVYFQVEDVCKKFDGLLTLENNGWKHKLPTPKKRKGKKRQTTKKSAPADSSNNAQLQAAREKREAERNRLREMKMAAKRARQEEITEEPVVNGEPELIEPQVTPKKAKTAQTPRTQSSSKRSRRRSQRLMMRSVFSPMANISSPCHVDVMDVPTAMLLDL